MLNLAAKAVILACMIFLVGCTTSSAPDSRVSYTVEFGIISDPSSTPITIDQPTEVIRWDLGVSEPSYGAQVRKFSSDTYEVYFEVYRKSVGGYELMATSPTYRGFGEYYDCGSHPGCHGTLLRFRKGMPLEDGYYKYVIHLDGKELKEIEFEFINTGA